MKEFFSSSLYFGSKTFQRLRENILNPNRTKNIKSHNILPNLFKHKSKKSKSTVKDTSNTAMMTHIDKCIIYARIVNLSIPYLSKNKKTYMFRTMKTLEPLDGKFSESKVNLEDKVCLYETAAIMKRIWPDGNVSYDVNLKFLSSFPTASIERLFSS